MKATRLCFTVSALTICACSAMHVRAALIDFNTAGDLAANFTVFVPGAGPPPAPFAEADGVGVGGSRGLSVTAVNDSGATLQTPSFNFGPDGAKIQVSMFLHTVTALGTTGEDRVFELNLLGLNTNTPTGAHTGVGGKIEFLPNDDGNDTIGVEFRRNNGDPSGGAGQDPGPTFFDVQPGTWYKATYTATQGGGGTSIAMSMTLDDYGATGTSLVAANVYSFATTVTQGLTAGNSDAEVFGAFRVRNGTRLFDALDNYEIVQVAVPEPGSLALASLALIGLAAKRRR